MEALFKKHQIADIPNSYILADNIIPYWKKVACLADGIYVLNLVTKIYFHYGTLVRKIYEYLRETF